MYIHVYTVKIKKIKKKQHRKPLKKLFFVKIVIKIDSQTTKHSIYSLFNGLYFIAEFLIRMKQNTDFCKPYNM